MVEVEFLYEGKSIIIQGSLTDKISSAIQKFLTKVNCHGEVIYLYQGTQIDQQLKIEDFIGKDSQASNKMTIMVNSLENDDDENLNSTMIRSNYNICPKCGENIMVKIKDYKLVLENCKNNHCINNLSLNEFNRTQIIDISKIICGKCKRNNKSSTYNNHFFRCNGCKMNLCPLCKSSHDSTHFIIDYDQKDYICELHNEPFMKYCTFCRKNICLLCSNEHKAHETISFDTLIPDMNEIKDLMNKLRKEIDIFKVNINNIILNLNKMTKNIEQFYKIYFNIMNSYKENCRNYETLKNVNEIKNNFYEELSQINNDNNLKSKLLNILNIYNKMNKSEINQKCNEMNLFYNINNDDRIIGKINIFGKEFVKTNINKCKLLFQNRQYDLMESFDIKNLNTHILELKLIGWENITNMSHMFDNCNSLSPLSNISDLDTKNIKDMSYIFCGCSSLKALPDISNWNTEEVVYMDGMFYGCSSLKYLPDISNWNTKKVTNMNGMFYNCFLLKTLPDISKWDTQSVKYMGGTFQDLSSQVPLSQEDIINIRKKANKNNSKVDLVLCGMFSGCENLVFLPDISKWNMSNVIDTSGMFFDCVSLSYLPDISKWDTSNITNMTSMFARCSSLTFLPDITRWNIKKLESVILMFSNCKNLSYIPDFSKWKKINYLIGMFTGCSKNLKISSKFQSKLI